MLGPAEHFFRALCMSYVRFYVISLRWYEIHVIRHGWFTRNYLGSRVSSQTLPPQQKLHPPATLQLLRAGLHQDITYKTQNTIPSPCNVISICTLQICLWRNHDSMTGHEMCIRCIVSQCDFTGGSASTALSVGIKRN
jgi:hypothetical protein